MRDTAMPRRWLPLLLCCTAALALPFSAPEETDSEESRRVLGSSVVTSVSVIMDLGNGTKKYFADAAGRPVPKPSAAAMVGSPAGLLNPDRYEFYTFDEAGDLVKRLMTLDEIQSIIANGETELGEAGLPNYYNQNLPLDSAELPPAASFAVTDKTVEEAEATDIGELSSSVPGVHDVVVSVQNILNGELEASKNKIPFLKPVPSPAIPVIAASSDSSSSWDIILPGIVSNTGIVPIVANQSVYSPNNPVLNTTQKLDDTSTESIPLNVTQEYNNSADASANQKPLSSASSGLTHVEQATSSSVNIHSKLPSLLSSPTASHTSSSLPPSLSSSSASLSSSLSSILSSFSHSSSTQSSLPSLSSQFASYSSSPKPSSLLPLTVSHPSAKPSSAALPSISTSQSVTSETPLSPQSSSLTTYFSSKPLSPSTTVAPRPQSSPSNSSYPNTVKTVTNPPLKDSTNVNKNKPLNQYEFYGKPTIVDNHIAAATQKPILTSHLPSFISKIPSASPDVETESVDASAITSVTKQSLSSSNEFSKVTLSNEKIMLPQKVAGISTVPSQSLLSHFERTTTKPSTPASSTASSTGSDSISLGYENSEILEPAMVMISSSESSNHGDISAAQEFLHLLTSTSNTSSTTYSLSTERTQPSKTTYKPSTVPDRTWKPASQTQTTPTTADITKITIQPPSSSSNSVQTSTHNLLETTKSSLTTTDNENEGLSTEKLIKINDQNINSTTTTELPLSSTTWKDSVQSLLINEAAGFVPIKIESPVGAVSLPSPANENLDMPPELAESVLGVLSQVADVEGAATTIDYGESGLYIFTDSTISTKHIVTESISSTESSISSSPKSSANYASLQTSIRPLHNNSLAALSRSTLHSSPTTEKLSAVSLYAESTQQNAATEQSIRETPTSQALSNLYLKETTDDQTDISSLSMENFSSVYEQEMTERTTTETEGEQTQSNPELKNDGTGDDEETEEVTISEYESNVSKENIKENVVNDTSVELLSSASNNNEALKTNFEIQKTESYDEETVTDVSEESDSEFGSNIKVTLEAADDVTTGNDRIELRESTVSSVTELTTEQPSPAAHRNNVKNEVIMENVSKLHAEETFTGTEAEELYNTATTTTPETITLRDIIESLIQTTKLNTETSTETLTKYKKVAEESVQDNLTLKPIEELIMDKISTDDKSSFQEQEAYDDKQNVFTESQESTTQLETGTAEDAMQKEEFTIPTSTAINNEFVQGTETRTDANITDKKDESIDTSEAKINTDLTESSELTTELLTEDNSKDVVGHKISSFDKIHGVIAEDIMTEVTSKYEAEVTTVDIRFNSDGEDNPSLRDEEPKGTTDAPVTEDEGSAATTTASPETETENYFTVTSLEKGNEVSVKDVYHWETDITSSTDSSEKRTEYEITKTTVDNTSWTKHSTISPSQANNNKVRDKTVFGSTPSPATIISVLTNTAENDTMPVEMLKVSGLNEEKVKDTKIKANSQASQGPQTYAALDLEPAPQENLGLEATSAGLEEDVRRFAELCNELAFRLWTSVTTKGLTMPRSVVISPFAITSLLAMVFLGARGPTSYQMNDVLRLDDMVTFNPHQVFRNVTESITLSKNQGIATAAFVRQLYSDRTKGKLLDFYKERAQQFYDGHVEEVNFSVIGDLVRRRTNLLIKRQTHGRVPEYLRGSNILLRPPLAIFSANIFQTDCSQASTYGRDGEMYFTVMPAVRQRRLVPIPAVVWFSGFLAGYEPVLDATAAAIGNDNSPVSLVMVLPGQQGQQAPGDGLQRLEQRLIETSYRRGAWSRLLRSLLPRPGLEIQIPRFSHRSLLNVTSPLQRMGLKDLFSQHADLRGINGIANNLHLSDIIQVNTFGTCAEESIGSRHHVEVYPTSPQRSGREELDEDPKKGSVHFDDLDALGLSSLPLALRPRQARLPDAPRLRFDRPFLYFVRHNPTGLVLHMGRFNPRLIH